MLTSVSPFKNQEDHSEDEQKFQALLIELPKLEWKAKKVKASYIANVLNAIGERMVQKERIHLLIALNFLSDHIKDDLIIQECEEVVKIFQKSEDLLEIYHFINFFSKFSFEEKVFKEVERKIYSFCLGYNHLSLSNSEYSTSHKDYFSIVELEAGINSHQHQLLSKSIEFKPSFRYLSGDSKHDKNMVVKVSMKQLNNGEPAADLAEEVLSDLLISDASEFKAALETLIIWKRNIKSEADIELAIKVQGIALNKISAKYSVKSLLRYKKEQYFKETFIKERLDYIQQGKSHELKIYLWKEIIQSILECRARSRFRSAEISVAYFLEPTLLISEEEEEKDDVDELELQLMQVRSIPLYKIINETFDQKLEQNFQNQGQLERKCCLEYFQSEELVTDLKFQEYLIKLSLLLAEEMKDIEFREIFNLFDNIIAVGNEGEVSLYHPQILIKIIQSLIKGRDGKLERLDFNRITKVAILRLLSELKNYEKDTYYLTKKLMDSKKLISKAEKTQIIKFLILFVELNAKELSITDQDQSYLLINELLQNLFSALNSDIKQSLRDQIQISILLILGILAESKPETINNLWNEYKIPQYLSSIEASPPLLQDLIPNLIFFLSAFASNPEGSDAFLIDLAIFENFVKKGTNSLILLEFINGASRDMKVQKIFTDSYKALLDKSRIFALKQQQLILFLCRETKRDIEQFTIMEMKDSLTRGNDDEKNVENKVKDQLLDKLKTVNTFLNEIVKQFFECSQIDSSEKEIYIPLFIEFLTLQVPISKQQEFLSQQFMSSSSKISFLKQKSKNLNEVKDFNDFVLHQINNIFAQLKTISEAEILPTKSFIAIIQKSDLEKFRPLKQDVTYEERYQIYTTLNIFEEYLHGYEFYFDLIQYLTIEFKQALLSQKEKFVEQLNLIWDLKCIIESDRAKVISEKYYDLIIHKNTGQGKDDKLWETDGVHMTMSYQAYFEEFKKQSKEIQTTKKVVSQFVTDVFTQNSQFSGIHKKLGHFQCHLYLLEELGEQRYESLNLGIDKIQGEFMVYLSKIFKPAHTESLSLDKNPESIRDMFQFFIQVEKYLAYFQGELTREQKVFYEFCVAGGLLNLVELYEWLKKVADSDILNEEQNIALIFIFKRCCEGLYGQFSQIYSLSKNDSYKGLKKINMQKSFKNAENFFYYVFGYLTKRFVLEENENVIRKYSDVRFASLQSIPLHIMKNAAINFSSNSFFKPVSSSLNNVGGVFEDQSENSNNAAHSGNEEEKKETEVKLENHITESILQTLDMNNEAFQKKYELANPETFSKLMQQTKLKLIEWCMSALTTQNIEHQYVLQVSQDIQIQSEQDNQMVIDYLSQNIYTLCGEAITDLKEIKLELKSVFHQNLIHTEQSHEKLRCQMQKQTALCELLKALLALLSQLIQNSKIQSEYIDKIAQLELSSLFAMIVDMLEEQYSEKLNGIKEYLLSYLTLQSLSIDVNYAIFLLLHLKDLDQEGGKYEFFNELILFEACQRAILLNKRVSNVIGEPPKSVLSPPSDSISFASSFIQSTLGVIILIFSRGNYSSLSPSDLKTVQKASLELVQSFIIKKEAGYSQSAIQESNSLLQQLFYYSLDLQAYQSRQCENMTQRILSILADKGEVETEMRIPFIQVYELSNQISPNLFLKTVMSQSKFDHKLTIQAVEQVEEAKDPDQIQKYLSHFPLSFQKSNTPLKLEILPIQDELEILNQFQYLLSIIRTANEKLFKEVETLQKKGKIETDLLAELGVVRLTSELEGQTIFDFETDDLLIFISSQLAIFPSLCDAFLRQTVFNTNESLMKWQIHQYIIPRILILELKKQTSNARDLNLDLPTNYIFKVLNDFTGFNILNTPQEIEIKRKLRFDLVEIAYQGLSELTKAQGIVTHASSAQAFAYLLILNCLTNETCEQNKKLKYVCLSNFRTSLRQILHREGENLEESDQINTRSSPDNIVQLIFKIFKSKILPTTLQTQNIMRNCLSILLSVNNLISINKVVAKKEESKLKIGSSLQQVEKQEVFGEKQDNSIDDIVWGVSTGEEGFPESPVYNQSEEEEDRDVWGGSNSRQNSTNTVTLMRNLGDEKAAKRNQGVRKPEEEKMFFNLRQEITQFNRTCYLEFLNKQETQIRSERILNREQQTRSEMKQSSLFQLMVSNLYTRSGIGISYFKHKDFEKAVENAEKNEKFNILKNIVEETIRNQEGEVKIESDLIILGEDEKQLTIKELNKDLFDNSQIEKSEVKEQKSKGGFDIEKILYDASKDLAAIQEVDQGVLDCIESIQSDTILFESLILVIFENPNMELEVLQTISMILDLETQTQKAQSLRQQLFQSLLFGINMFNSLTKKEIEQKLIDNKQSSTNMILLLIRILKYFSEKDKEFNSEIISNFLNTQKSNAVEITQFLHSHFSEKFELAHSLNHFYTICEILKDIKENSKIEVKIKEGISELLLDSLKQMSNSTLKVVMLTNEFIESLLDLSLLSSQLSKKRVISTLFFQLSLQSDQNQKILMSILNLKIIMNLSTLSDKLAQIPALIDSQKLELMPSNSLNQSDLDSQEFDQSMQMMNQIDSNKEKKVVFSRQEIKGIKSNLDLGVESKHLKNTLFSLNQIYKLALRGQSKITDIKIGEILNLQIESIKSIYKSEELADFVNSLSSALKIIYNSTIEINEGLVCLVECVFSCYYPEIHAYMSQNQTSQTKSQAKDKKIVKSVNRQHQVQSKKLNFLMQDLKGEPDERTIELNNFCLKNYRVMNKIANKGMTILAYDDQTVMQVFPCLIDFENKKKNFAQSLKDHHNLGESRYSRFDLQILRSDFFNSSYLEFKNITKTQLLERMNVRFIGEGGIDASGLTKDFFCELSKEIFKSDMKLFKQTSNYSTYYLNPGSKDDQDHLQYFKFIGRVFGKAIFEECLLECYFAKAFYKFIIGDLLELKDIESYDSQLYQAFKWMLNNDISGMNSRFVIEEQYSDTGEDIELIEGGKDILVTNENKYDYLERLINYKLYLSVAPQIEAFLEGFNELVPQSLVKQFTANQLELLISGLPTYDLVDDLKLNTNYREYSASSPQIIWLFEILTAFENSERAEFLQFVTGSSKVPVEGFKGLHGMGGIRKFNIVRVAPGYPPRLPSGHTCFNQLDLPEYDSKEVMQEKLLMAIKEKSYGFS